MSIDIINEKDIPYRNEGPSGPKYLMRGPFVDIGMVIIQPGEDFTCHLHDHVEEDFLTLEGSVDIYIDGERFVLHPGDLIQVAPKKQHYLKNVGAVPWRAVFVKAPFDPNDKINIDWVPEAEE